MSQEKDDRDQGSLFRVAKETPRILETSDGWKLVGFADRELGRIEGLRQHPFNIPKNGGRLRSQLYFMDRLYWGHAWALLFIQGAPIQQLIGPNYLFIAGDRCSPFDARQHLKDVLVARIEEAPPATSLEEAMVELRRWSS